MSILLYFTEDKLFTFKIHNKQRVKNVHYHTFDDKNKYQIVELPFTIENDIVTAIMPANVKFLVEPELEFYCTKFIPMINYEEYNKQ